MNTPIISKVFIETIKTYDLQEILNFLSKTLSCEPFKSKLSRVNKVLLKPNMLGAHHPDKAVTTHPTVLEAMIIFLKGLNKEIIVGDSPGGVVSAYKVWQETGMLEVCQRHQVKLIDFGKDGINSIHINATDYHFEKQIFEVDGIINLAKMKTHSLMLYTGAVKNFYGLIPGLYKSELHKKYPQPKDFSNVITDIYSKVKDKVLFNVLDAVLGMEGEGPSAGRARYFERLFIAEQASALDYTASRMMGFKIENLDYIKEAMKLDGISIENISLSDKYQGDIFTNVAIKEVQFRKMFLDSLPKSIKKIFNALFNYYPAFENSCRKCGICIKSCPVSAITLEGIAKTPTLDKKKCIKCMCCHELCPFHAVIVKKSLLAKVFLKSFKRKKAEFNPPI